jgi:hypothetical protein
MESLSAEYEIPGNILSQKHLNKVKNWLKHSQGMNEEKYIDIDPERQAIQYIIRTVATLFTHSNMVTSERSRFFAWLTENRKDLYRIHVVQSVPT